MRVSQLIGTIMFSFGLYQVVGRSHIAAPIRLLAGSLSATALELLECALCSGFWYACAYSAGILRLGILDTIAYGFAGAGGALFLSEALDLVDAARAFCAKPAIEITANVTTHEGLSE